MADAPTRDDLLAVMREVRDSSDYDANPHERGCSVTESYGCNCARGRRHMAAWKAFHAALAASGVGR